MPDHRPPTDQSDSERPLRVVLFGMVCSFTEPILTALNTSTDVDLCAVVLPRQPAFTRSNGQHTVLSIIETYEIPIINVSNRAALTSPGVRDALTALASDVIVIACFPWRLPGWIVSLPQHGCLNVHPSLLPAGRGPEPVFWAFRWGLRVTGVTLHLIDAGLDTGPIVAQRNHVIEENATMVSLEHDLAQIGAELLLHHLPDVSTQTSTVTPQDKTSDRDARFPDAGDLVVPTSWTASEASRFINAVTPVFGAIPVLVLATGQRIAIDQVLGVSEHVSLDQPLHISGDEVSIRFSDGDLTCRIATATQPLRLFTRHE